MKLDCCKQSFVDYFPIPDWVSQNLCAHSTSIDRSLKTKEDLKKTRGMVLKWYKKRKSSKIPMLAATHNKTHFQLFMIERTIFFSICWLAKSKFCLNLFSLSSLLSHELSFQTSANNCRRETKSHWVMEKMQILTTLSQWHEWQFGNKKPWAPLHAFQTSWKRGHFKNPWLRFDLSNLFWPLDVTEKNAITRFFPGGGGAAYQLWTAGTIDL